MQKFLAKLSPPQIRNVYERTRLFDKLDETCSATNSIWISAPAGSGKTTLVTSYAQSRQLPLLWYQIDSGDSDIASFYYYLGLAVQSFANETAPPLPALTPEYMQALPVFTRNFFRQLFSQLPANTIIVFDNYQDVAEDTPLYELLAIVLDEIPKDIYLAFVSRVDPLPAYARAQAHGKLELIDKEVMWLDKHEARGIAVLHDKADISDENLEYLLQKTHGWTTGLILYLEQENHYPPESAVQSFSDQDLLFKYFAGVLFQGLSSSIQTFLLHTAFFTKYQLQQSVEINDEQIEPQSIISELLKRNLFITCHYGEQLSYEYHPLFREFLQQQAMAQLGEVTCQKIINRTAELLSESGQLEAAADLYIRAQNWDSLAGMILVQGKELAANGRLLTLRNWSDVLPERIVNDNGWLLFWKAASWQIFDLLSARQFYDQAYNVFKMSNEPIGMILSWAGFVETFTYIWGDMSEIDKHLEEVNQVLHQLPDLPDQEIEARITHAMLSLFMWKRTTYSVTKKWLERAERVIDSGVEPSLKLMLGVTAIITYSAILGEVTRGENLLSRLESIANQAINNNLAQSLWYVSCAYLAGNNGDRKQCDCYVKQGLTISERSGLHFMDFLLLTMGAYGTLAENDFPATQQYLKKMQQALNPYDLINRAYYHMFETWCAMLGKREADAVSHIEHAARVAEETKSPVGMNWIEMTRCHLEVRQGKYEQSLETADRVMAWAEQVSSNNIKYELLMTKAYIYLELDNQALARKNIQSALKIGREQQYFMRPWIGWCPEIMVKLCEFALQQDIENSFVCNIIEKNDYTATTKDISILNKWPYPVKVYTLGRFNLFKDGEPLQSGKRVSKRSLDIIKAIIAFGSFDVNAQMLSGVLWPEQDGDASMNVFTTTLHRLRKLIGQDTILYENGRLSLNPDKCWVDVWGIESQLNQVNKNSEMIIDGTSLYQVDEILNNYPGPFLSGDDDATWNLSMRERLDRRVTDLILNLCQRLELDQQYELAKKYYHQGLGIDGLNERFYQGIMRCCLQQGLIAEGMAIYQRCVDWLMRHLDVAPSAETEELKAQLQN